MGNSKPIVWITGAEGLIGHALVRTAPLYAAEYLIRGTTRADLDLTHARSVSDTFSAIRPNLVIHCAALTKTGACEDNPRLARSVNVESTERLAGLARGIPFVFFSSDLVFDGRRGQYDESAPVCPLNVYGETKAAAERIVLSNPGHTVIRTSLNGGTSPKGDRAFNEELRRAWEAGRTVRLFTDEFRCPIAAAVTARAVWELIAVNKPGLYHLAGAERLSRWQIGRLIASRWPALRPKLEPISRRDFPGPPRPEDTSLNCAKIQSLLGFPLPGLTDWLARHPHEPF